MEWFCEYNDDRIAVYFGESFKGYYVLLEEPYCEKCAHPDIVHPLFCNCKLLWVDRIYAMGYFRKADSEDTTDDELTHHINVLKHWFSHAEPLAKAMALTVKNRYPELLDSTTIIPIPLYNDELRERGYNQAMELSRMLGRELELDVLDALEKTRKATFKSLNLEERKESVKGLYRLKAQHVDKIVNQRIIIVDDIVTTGTTMDECSRLLKEAGAKVVNTFVAGRTG